MSEIIPEPVAPVTEPEPTEPEPWGGPSREEWEAITSGLSSLSEYAAQQRARDEQFQQVYGGQPQQDQNDPLASFAEMFGPEAAQAIAAYTQAQLAPRVQFEEQLQLGEAEERARDILADIATREGDFDVGLARMRADAVFPDMVARYGQTPKAAEEALAAGAAQQREYEAAVRQQAIAQYTNQISTLAGAPAEPGSTYTVGVETRTTPDWRRGGSVTSALFGG